MFVLWVFAIVLPYTTASEDVCMADTFKAQCDPGDVVVMETALYGRMEAGTCLKSGAKNIGCSNDIMYLLDQWCSGKRQCEFVPLLELAKIKDHWCGDLLSFMRADYSCLSIIKPQPSNCHTPMTLTQHEGFLASHVTDQTGCGSPSAPWVIEAKHGQTINISILDFATSTSEDIGTARCNIFLGSVFERSLKLNNSICGGSKRKHEIYQSKSNAVEIQINTNRNPDGRFILHYQIVGCADLSSPAHAWYTRDGNQATIGCDVTERVWHLECQGNRWKGVVGNCSMPDRRPDSEDDDKTDFPLYRILMLGAIIGVTTLLSLVILCVGLLYTRRYRTRHRDNKEQMTALTIYRKATETTSSHYRPVSSMCSSCHGTLPSRDQTSEQSKLPKSPNTEPGYAHIWETPLPDPTHKRAPSSVSEYLAPRNTDSVRNNPPGGASNTQKTSLLEDDNTSGYYCPETGHKYYVLDQAQC